jgi:hypothetical protein
MDSYMPEMALSSKSHEVALSSLIVCLPVVFSSELVALNVTTSAHPFRCAVRNTVSL